MRGVAKHVASHRVVPREAHTERINDMKNQQPNRYDVHAGRDPSRPRIGFVERAAGGFASYLLMPDQSSRCLGRSPDKAEAISMVRCATGRAAL